MPALLRALAALPLALPLASAQCGVLEGTFSAFLALQNGTGGGVLRVQQSGREAFTTSGGTLRKGSSEPFVANTTFELASVTKTFVSALVLRKVVEGATTLDTTAKSILGSALPSRVLVVGGVDLTAQITLRQLLSHRSGLADYWDAAPLRSAEAWYAALNLTAPTSHPEWSSYADFQASRFEFEGIVRAVLEPTVGPTKVWTPTEVVSFFPGYDNVTLGTFSYSDTNYVILGLVVERLYNKGLNEAIQHDLFASLTGVHPANTYMRYNVRASPPADTAAVGSARYAVLAHRYSDSDPVAGVFDLTMTDRANFPDAITTSYFYSADWAGGGLVSNADELARWVVALAQSSAAPWAEVRSLLLNSTAIGQPYSYGFGIQAVGTLLGHSGYGGAVMYYDVEQDVMITGTNSNTAQSMTDFVFDLLPAIQSCAAAQNRTTVTATTTTTVTATTTNLKRTVSKAPSRPSFILAWTQAVALAALSWASASHSV